MISLAFYKRITLYSTLSADSGVAHGRTQISLTSTESDDFSINFKKENMFVSNFWDYYLTP